MIKFQNMTKEQKNKAMLIGVVAVAAIFALKQFVIGPMLAKSKKALQEYETLAAKVTQANKAIVDETETLRKLEESRQALAHAHRDLIPSSDNLLAWATKTIYGHAREVGIDMESVAETEVQAAGFMAKEQSKLSFKPYGVRISARCSYAQLVRLVNTLEESNAHLCISNIDVTSQASSPEWHTVSIIVEWPSWKDAARAKEFSVPDVPKDKNV